MLLHVSQAFLRCMQVRCYLGDLCLQPVPQHGWGALVSHVIALAHDLVLDAQDFLHGIYPTSCGVTSCNTECKTHWQGHRMPFAATLTA